MLGQDEHQIWGPSSIAIGKTASSNVVENFRKSGRSRVSELTQKSDNYMNNPMVILVRPVYGTGVWATQQRYTGAETPTKTLNSISESVWKIWSNHGREPTSYVDRSYDPHLGGMHKGTSAERMASNTPSRFEDSQIEWKSSRIAGN